jgi:hypothetical protein
VRWGGFCVLAERWGGICVLAERWGGICVLAERWGGMCVLAERWGGCGVSVRVLLTSALLCRVQDEPYTPLLLNLLLTCALDKFDEGGLVEGVWLTSDPSEHGELYT